MTERADIKPKTVKIRPLVLISVSFAIGIFLANIASWSLWTLLILLPISVSIGLRVRHARWWHLSILIAVMLLGSARYLLSTRIPTNDVSLLAPKYLTLTGAVDSDVDLSEKPDSSDPKTAAFTLKVSSAELPLPTDPMQSYRVAVTGLVRVTVPIDRTLQYRTVSNPLSPFPNYGDNISAKGRLELPDGAKNPDGFDYRAYLKGKNIRGVLSVRHASQVHIEPIPGANSLLALGYNLRHFIVIRAFKSLSARESNLLKGILIAERSGISPAFRDDLTFTGTSHIISPAGLHVGVVVGLLVLIRRLFRIHRRPGAMLSIAILILYAIIAGGRPAILRAVIVAGIYLFSDVVEREPDMPNALSVAALCLLLSNPSDLFDPGFQLSFAVVITILLFMPRFSSLLKLLSERIPGEGISAKLSRNAVRWTCAAFLLSLTAQIGILPLGAFYFHSISLVSPIANLLIVPTLFPIIALGFIAVMAGAINPVLAMPIEWLLHLLLSYNIHIVEFLARVPFAYIGAPQPQISILINYYIVLWVLAIAWKRHASVSAHIAPS